MATALPVSPTTNVGKALFAWRVDEGLLTLFADQLRGSLDAVEEGWAEAAQPEIHLAVAVVYYVLSFRLLGQGTAGMRHFRLVPRGPTLPALPLVFLAAVYAYQRLKRTALVDRWEQAEEGSIRRIVHRKLPLVDLACKVLALGNTIAYLSGGTSYPDLLYSLSLFAVGSATPASAAAPSPGLRSLLYVRYHQLLLNSLTGVARTGAFSRGAILWLYRSLLQQLLRARGVASAVLVRVGLQRQQQQQQQPLRRGPGLGASDPLTCCACGGRAETPHAPECGHVHCYLCLQLGLRSASASSPQDGADAGAAGAGADDTASSSTMYQCPQCGAGVSQCLRVSLLP